MRTISRGWGRAWCLSGRHSTAGRRFRAAQGCDPPWFLTLAPTRACNLTCAGCYADAGSVPEHLPWAVLERVMAEARRAWDVPLFVFSGGEPLLYRSGGHDVLDAVEQHPDCLFLMFTNGTLIDRPVARRLERLANLTPALSVEGFEQRTDARRGKGQFARVLESMSFLREAGVPFGISITLTQDNLSEVLSDRFLDFFFREQGAFYGFLFQYLPVGRGARIDWMLTAAQRIASWQRVWQVVEEKRIFLFDFWNHGPMVGGCMAAGRQGGYLYIDWTGKVMPCVFAPYSPVNIREVHARGGTLEDAWQAPFFRTIRAWQRAYGYSGAPVPTPGGNWLRCCPVRDHPVRFHAWVEEHRPEPEDANAGHVLQDPAYRAGMAACSEAFGRAADPLWRSAYLGLEEDP